VRDDVRIKTCGTGVSVEVAGGGSVPADGNLGSGCDRVEEMAMTGEAIRGERATGEKVPAGATSVDRRVTLEVLSEPGASAIDRILTLIEEAEERRAPIERFIDRFSRIYTPVIMVIALMVTLIPPLMFDGGWQEWIYKGLTLLL
ncbi:Zn(II)/Cd(II)/Pb(II) translocating P-type ATPase ZntA, partial [Leptospira interrogans serovar Pomona]|nr:Zn(II)/Cd(II)/Pb(II) translocating P-type ATPase ZntA [Leptospira interrogans serovar Pomona]